MNPQLELVQEQLTVICIDVDNIYIALQKVKTDDKYSDALVSVTMLALTTLSSQLAAMADELGDIIDTTATQKGGKGVGYV